MLFDYNEGKDLFYKNIDKRFECLLEQDLEDLFHDCILESHFKSLSLEKFVELVQRRYIDLIRSKFIIRKDKEHKNKKVYIPRIVDYIEYKSNDSYDYTFPINKDIANKLKQILKEDYHIQDLKFNDNTNEEIAEILGLSLRTLERKISKIKKIIKQNKELFTGII